MTNQDIMDTWAKIYGRKEADRLVGAVGSSEPPPDPWRGLSGPTGPVATLSAVASVNGVTIVSGDTIHVRSDGVYVNDKNVAPQNMSGFTKLEFGSGVVPEPFCFNRSNAETQIGSIAQNGTSTPYNTRLTRPFSETVAARCAVDPEFRAALAEEEIPVTDEMIAVAKTTLAPVPCSRETYFATIYRAMAAVAPVELVTAHEDRIAALESAASEKDREIVQLRAEREAWKYLYEMAKPDSDTRMLRADETGNHDYVGPVKDGKAVPDPTHERFHGSVGDVIAGNVMRPARDQMERALADARVKDGKTPPPFPSAHAVPDHRRIGS